MYSNTNTYQCYQNCVLMLIFSPGIILCVSMVWSTQELYCDYFIMFKGSAVRTTDTFNVGDFLLEYRGTVEQFDCTTEQAHIPHTYLFKALSHLAGQLTGKRTKSHSVRDFSPVVNYTCPFAKNSSNVVSGREPVEYSRSKRTSNGRGTE
jgi:hypothetical protein